MPYFPKEVIRYVKMGFSTNPCFYLSPQGRLSENFVIEFKAIQECVVAKCESCDIGGKAKELRRRHDCRLLNTSWVLHTMGLDKVEETYLLSWPFGILFLIFPAVMDSRRSNWPYSSCRWVPNSTYTEFAIFHPKYQASIRRQWQV